MKVLTTNISTLSQDIYLRGDAKYYYAIENNLFNLFNTSNNVRLSDIIEEKYSICPYLDDVEALSLILCKHQKVQKTKMYFREVVYRPLDCILAEDGAFVKGGAAVHLDP